MSKGSAKNTDTPTFIITNNDLKLKREIINIADHLGIPYSQFVRNKLKEIRDSFPEHMKKPRLD